MFTDKDSVLGNACLSPVQLVPQDRGTSEGHYPPGIQHPIVCGYRISAPAIPILFDMKLPKAAYKNIFTILKCGLDYFQKRFGKPGRVAPGEVKASAD